MPPKSSLIDQFPQLRGLILDMDGVLWRDQMPLGSLPVLFARIQALGIKFTLATNNSMRTVEQYQEKLRGFGVELAPEHIVNAGEAVGFFLKERFPEGGPVFVVGEPGLKATLKGYGFTAEEDPKTPGMLAVVGAIDRSFTYQKLFDASALIYQGLPFIGTNPDRTLPTPGGLVPGSGSILAAIEAATGVAPIIAGKPEPLLFRLAMERMGTTPVDTLAVGDRLETDIAGGQAVGCLTALVLSGVSTLAQAQVWTPPPDLISSDLTALLMSE